MKIFVIGAMIAIALLLCIGCCCIPCARSLCTRMIHTALGPLPPSSGMQMPLLLQGELWEYILINV